MVEFLTVLIFLIVLTLIVAIVGPVVLGVATILAAFFLEEVFGIETSPQALALPLLTGLVALVMLGWAVAWLTG